MIEEQETADDSDAGITSDLGDVTASTPSGLDNAPDAVGDAPPVVGGEDDPAWLIKSLREVQAKLANSESRINELQAYRDGREAQAPVAPELADDDFVSVKDMRATFAKMFSDASKEDRAFITEMRTMESNRQRDDLLSKYPDAMKYVPQMQDLALGNPNLSIEQLYVLTSHKDEVAKARHAVHERRDRAAIVGRPSVKAEGKPGAGMSLDDRLGLIWDQGAEARG